MKSLFLALTILVGSAAFAGETIKSSDVSVNPARITDREVIVDKKENGGVLVQVIAEKTNGATDVSNTHRIILSISQLGEMTEKMASFVIGRSMGLTKVERLSGGIYRVSYNDADAYIEAGEPKVSKTIDARDAVNLVMKGACEEFSTCKLDTSVSVETSKGK